MTRWIFWMTYAAICIVLMIVAYVVSFLVDDSWTWIGIECVYGVIACLAILKAEETHA